MDEDKTKNAKSPEEMKAEIINRLMWVFFASMTVGIVVLIETLFLNRGCNI